MSDYSVKNLLWNGIKTYGITTVLSPLWLPALKHLPATQHSTYVQNYHQFINYQDSEEEEPADLKWYIMHM